MNRRLIINSEKYLKEKLEKEEKRVKLLEKKLSLYNEIEKIDNELKQLDEINSK